MPNQYMISWAKLSDGATGPFLTGADHKQVRLCCTQTKQEGGVIAYVSLTKNAWHILSQSVTKNKHVVMLTLILLDLTFCSLWSIFNPQKSCSTLCHAVPLQMDQT